MESCLRLPMKSSGRSLKQRAQLQGYLEDEKSEEEILRPFYRYGRTQQPKQGDECLN